MPSSEDPSDTESLHPNLVICPSKALTALFTKIRDETTPSSSFIFHSRRIMHILAEDAIAELPHTPTTISTPCGTFNGLSPPPPSHLLIVSIIRAGDALLESVRDLLPGVSVGKILIQRDESSKEKLPQLYYSKLPPRDILMNCTGVLLCDPMLATGGSAMKAIEVLIEAGVLAKTIIFVNVICCPEGLAAMRDKYPEVKIVTACVDERLNEEKYIVPGLGDYGDRYFNT